MLGFHFTLSSQVLNTNCCAVETNSVHFTLNKHYDKTEQNIIVS